MGKKALIIDLIRQDLINYKLMSEFDSSEYTEIDTENYRLEISRIIFEMLNIEHSRSVDSIFDQYNIMLKEMEDINATHCSDKITDLATDIYAYLKEQKNKAVKDSVKNLHRLKSKFEIIHSYLKWSVGNYSKIDPEPMEGYALYFKHRHSAYPRRFISLLTFPEQNKHI